MEKLEGFPREDAPYLSPCVRGESGNVRIGVIDRDHLKPEKKKKITDFVPLMKEGKRAVFWAFLDGPALAEAIRSLARTGKIVEKMGRSAGVNMKTVLRASEVLEKAGTLTVIMPSPGEGILEWTKSPSSAEGKR